MLLDRSKGNQSNHTRLLAELLCFRPRQTREPYLGHSWISIRFPVRSKRNLPGVYAPSSPSTLLLKVS